MPDSKKTSYSLSRAWFDYCFENPEKINPNHSALFFFAIEHCNRLGWKDKFGFPSTMAMEALGIKSYKTYIKTLNEVIDMGFIHMIQKSKNQYSANIIALVKNTKAHTKAHTKALGKAMAKHGRKQVQSNDTILKPITLEPITIPPISPKGEGVDYRKWTEDYFRKEVWKLKDKYSVEELENFFGFWTEKTPTGKMRFTKEKTWDTGRRIANAKRMGVLSKPESIVRKTWDEIQEDKLEKQVKELKEFNAKNKGKK